MAQAGFWRALAATGHLGTFGLLCAGIWLHAADSLVTATLMPAAIVDIGGAGLINWTVALYQVGAILAGAAAGAFTGRFGLRAGFVAATSVYAVGCLAAALAGTMPVVLAARLAQGLGGGMLMSLAYVATQMLFPRELWVRLMAVEAVIWTMAALGGPLIGSLFVELGVWRGAFWTFAVLAVVVLALALRLPRRASPDAAGAWPKGAIALLFAATIAIAAAGELRAPLPASALAAAGVLLLYGAARVDGASPQRMLPQRALSAGHPVGAGLAMVFLLSAASTGFWIYGPLVLQRVFDARPAVAGIILAGESIAWSLATLLVSRAPVARDALWIRLGATVTTLGACGFVPALVWPSLPAIAACVLAQGVGFGLLWPFLMGRFVVAVDAGEEALAAAAAANVQRIGYAVGASAAGIAANALGLAGPGGDIAAAAAAVFAVFAPVAILGAAAALRFTARRTEAAPAAT